MSKTKTTKPSVKRRGASAPKSAPKKIYAASQETPAAAPAAVEPVAPPVAVEPAPPAAPEKAPAAVRRAFEVHRHPNGVQILDGHESGNPVAIMQSGRGDSAALAIVAGSIARALKAQLRSFDGSGKEIELTE